MRDVEANQAVIFRHSMFKRTLANGVEVRGSVCLKFKLSLEQQEALEEFLAMRLDNEQVMGALLQSLEQKQKLIVESNGNEAKG